LRNVSEKMASIFCSRSRKRTSTFANGEAVRVAEGEANGVADGLMVAVGAGVGLTAEDISDSCFEQLARMTRLNITTGSLVFMP
jgi:hypothetical protein